MEDLLTDVEIAQREISKEGIKFEHKVVDTEEEFKKALTEFRPDLIISDYSMPKFDGMRALKITRSRIDYIPLIILTGSMNEETAVTCMKAGADDYVIKEKIRRLPFAVKEVLEKHLTHKAKKQALQDLNKSEKKYRLLVRNLNEGLMQVANNDRILYVNQALCDIFGYREDELIGKFGYKTLFLSVDHDFIKEKNSLRSEIPYEKYEIKGRKKSGEIIWLNISGSAVKNDNGDVVGSVGLLTDITERKRAEEAMKASEIKYRSLAENTSDLIVVIDLQGTITYISRSIEEETGFKEDEVIGKNIKTLLTEDSGKFALNILQERLVGKKYKSTFEVSLIDKTGQIIPFECGTSSISEKGKLKGFQIVARNITERKLVENKIREKDIQFRKLSKNVPDLIFQFTRRTDGRYCVPIASEGIKNIFGCMPEDVIDDFSPIAKVLHPEDQARVINDIEYSAKHLSNFTCEFRVQIPGRPDQWILSNSTPEKLPDGSITWYGFNANITERKLIEEKIEKSLIEKNILLKELYHRTKNNMQVIASMLKLQARHLGNKQLHNSYQEVITKINSMALVHQKLYEAQDLSSINLKEFISEVARNLQKSYRIKGTNIELKFNLQKVFVNIDTAIPLSLVITELISNVFKHAFPKGGKGIIKLNLFEDNEKKVVLELADNGVGIAQNLNLRKSASMGLQNVFTLIEFQMNGEISYLSKNGLLWRISFQHDVKKVRI